ncbi:tail length tape measure protein, partial [Martelella mediterranea]
MAQPFKFSMVFTADNSQAKTATQEINQAIQTTGRAAEAFGSEAAQGFSAFAGAAASAETAVQGVIAASTGLDRIGSGVSAANTTLAAFGDRLDEVRARYSPLFAAERQHNAEIGRIDEAYRIGAISIDQWVAATEREELANRNAVNSIRQRQAAYNNFVDTSFREQTDALLGVTGAPARSGEDIAAYGAQLDSLRAKYNPLYAVTQRYKQEVSEIRQAHRAGAISADEMTAAISRQRQATLATIDAIKGRNTAMAGADMFSDREGRFRRQNLTYQLFDIGQTAAMGMNPGMILAQQGPQIFQIYAGQGGVNMALKDFGSILGGIGRIITPVTAGIAGLTAATALGAIAYNNYLTSTKAVQTAASGLGRAVAGSASEMEASAEAGAAAAGISVTAARSMQTAFLRTGKIGSENFEALIGLSDDFAATMGMAAADAGSALADMFADPAKAADTLSKQYNLIDAATARQVRSLAEQNRLIEAQALLIDQLPEKLADAGEASTSLGRAWKSMREDASNFFGAIGGGINRAIDGPSDEQRLSDLQAEQAELYARLRRDDTGPLAGAMRGQIYRDLAEIELQIGILTSRLNAAEEKRQQAEARQKVTAASTIADASPALSTTNQIETYQNQIARLQLGISNLTTEDIEKGEGDRLNKALEAKEHALDGLIDKQSTLNELDRLDIQIANERNPQRRAELEARRKRLEYASQEVSQAKINEDAERAYNNVIASTIAGAKAKADQINIETDIRARLNAEVAAGLIPASDVNRLLQEELQLRPLIAAADSAGIENKKALTEAVEGLRTAYEAAAEEQRRAANEQALRAGQQELALLQARIGLVGAETAERRRAIAVLEEQKRLKERRVSENDPAYLERIEQAKAIADAESALERAQSNRDAIRTRQENIESLKTQMALIGATSAEQRRALAVLEERNRLTREGIDLDSEAGQTRLALAAAEAELTSAMERRQAQYEALRSQGEEAEQLRAEIALVGASENARRRELAVLEEMQAIRRDGLALGSQESQQRIQNARAIADQTSELERMRDAWGEVKSAGESAIDAIFNFDDLKNGDFASIFDNLTSSIGQTLMDLTINNPLKNRFLGGNYGTLDDIMNGSTGGGLLGALTGQNVGAMNVSAATVIVNGGMGGGFGSMGGLMQGFAANDNIAMNGLGGNLAAAGVDRAFGLL